MKKQIIFEQNGAETCLLSIKNVFGFSINYIEDKIKKHKGRWNNRCRKFQVPLSNVPELAKDLRQIDRSFCIEQVPTAVSEMISRYTLPDSKVKRQLLIDTNLVQRYSYVGDILIKNIVGTCQGFNKSKNYDKILIVTMQSKVLNWMQFLTGCKVRRLKFQQGQSQACLNQNLVWVCSYETLWHKYEQMSKYCFQTVIIDEAQILAQKLNCQHEPALFFRRFLLSRHFVFPILTKLYLAKLSILLPLLSIMLPQANFQWFLRRYKKQNMSELDFVLKTCCLYRFLNGSKREGSYHHYFHKWITPISEPCMEKIKCLNKKYSQVEQRKILEDPSNARNKTEKLYIEAIHGLLRQEKLEQISKIVSYYCLELNLKLAIILQTSCMYRSVQNFLCERQISYCHYQHHQEVLEFNRNPTILVCLVKCDFLAKMTLTKSLNTKNEVGGTRLDSYEPEQYLCLSGVKNALFPDIEWANQVRSKQESIRQLFKYAKRDVVRHYFILKGTYEEKWMKQLEQTLIKIQVNIKIKQDLQEQLEDDEVYDPVLAFSELNLAQTQEEYSHLQIIKGVTDIDEQFDRLEFEALQQKLEKQSKKKKKQEKARQKLLQRDSLAYHLTLPKQIKVLEQKKIHTMKRPECESQFEVSLRKIKTQSVKDKYTEAVVVYERVKEDKNLVENQEKIKQIKEVNSELEKVHENSETKITSEVLGLEQSKPKMRSSRGDDEKFYEAQVFKQDETDQAEIIQVRKPPPRQKIPKRKSQSMMVVLRPSVI